MKFRKSKVALALGFGVGGGMLFAAFEPARRTRPSCPSSIRSVRNCRRFIRRAIRSSAALRWSTLVLFWLWPPLGWLAAIATLWCRLFLSRSAARHAGARRHRGFAGRRPRQPGRQRCAADGTRSRRPAAAAHLDFHERVRLPYQSQPRRRPYRADRLSRRRLHQRRSRQSERRQRAQRVCHRTRGRQAHRRHSDRGPRGAAHRAVRARRRGDRCRPAHRHDPVRLARRRLSAGGDGAVGRRRADAPSPAKPCSPICVRPTSQRRRRRFQRRNRPAMAKRAAEKAIYRRHGHVTRPSRAKAHAAAALPRRSGAHAGAELRHVARAMRRAHRDPHGVRRPLRAGARRPSFSPRSSTASTAAWRGC